MNSPRATDHSGQAMPVHAPKLPVMLPAGCWGQMCQRMAGRLPHYRARCFPAGPIGNAASFQSVPELTSSDGSWSANPFLPGWDAEKMARLALVLSNGSLVDVPILNVRGMALDAHGMAHSVALAAQPRASVAVSLIWVARTEGGHDA